MKKGLSSLYKKSVLDHPVVVLVVLFLLLLFFLYYAKDFTLDASADSLMLEDDKDLQIFREFTERYGVQEFFVVTFKPDEPLFSQKSLRLLKQLRDRLKQVDRVDSVESILDIPLLLTSGFSFTEISVDSIKTLEDPAVDLQKAKKEILQNPIYKEYVINSDGSGEFQLIDNPQILNQVYTADNSGVRWSPDGSKLVFCSSQDDISNDHFTNYDIYTINTDGSNLSRLTTVSRGKYSNEQAIWSPNGAKILFKSTRVISKISW